MEIPNLNTSPSASVISCKKAIEWPIQFGSVSNIFGNDMMMTKGTHAAKKVAKFSAKPNLPSEDSIAIKPSLIFNCIAERNRHDALIAAPGNSKISYLRTGCLGKVKNKDNLASHMPQKWPFKAIEFLGKGNNIVSTNNIY